jgi:hypothetical protein
MAVDEFRGSAGLMAKNTRTMASASGLAALLPIGTHREVLSATASNTQGRVETPAVANDAGALPDSTNIGVLAPAAAGIGSDSSEPAPTVIADTDAAAAEANKIPSGTTFTSDAKPVESNGLSQLASDGEPQPPGDAGPDWALPSSQGPLSQPQPQTGAPAPDATSSQASAPSEPNASAMASIADAAAALAPAASPDLAISFPGNNFNTNQKPKPNSTIAAGINQIVTTENSRIQWYDKTGKLQSD